MSASGARGRGVCLPACRPEFCRSAGRRSTAHRHHAPSSSFNPAWVRFAAASACSAVRQLRPVLAAALLPLALLAGLSTEAAAQVECTTTNSDGAYSVPQNWALKPAGVAAGQKFRLLFITSTYRDATATGIATYNIFVQTRNEAGENFMPNL